MQRLTGAYTAVITPFDATGAIDEEGFRNNLRFQHQEGIDGVVVLGTTGETPTLTQREKQQLVTIAVEELRGKIPVIVGTGTYSTRETLESSLQAEQQGADALLIVTPYYNKPTQEGIYRHFQTIAEAVSIPIILYNIPGRCGVNIDIATVARLASLPNVIGLKESSGNMASLHDLVEQSILSHSPFDIVSGDDGNTILFMAIGGQGIISVAGNLIPGKIKSLVNLCHQNRFEEARRLHFELLPLFRDQFIETNPIPIKAAMNHCGLAAGPCRLPLCPLRPESEARLVKTLEKLQLLAGVHG